MIIDVLTDVNSTLKTGASRSNLSVNQQKLKDTAPGPPKDNNLDLGEGDEERRPAKSNAVAPKRLPDNSVDEVSKDNIGNDPMMESFEKMPEKHQNSKARANNMQSKSSVMTNDGVFPVTLPPAPEVSFYFSGLTLVVLPILVGTVLLVLYMLKVIPENYRLLVRLVGLYLPAVLATCFVAYISYKPLNSPTCKWMEEEDHTEIKQVLEHWNSRKFRRLGFRWTFDPETEAIELNVDANVESLPDDVSEANRKSDRGLSK